MKMELFPKKSWWERRCEKKRKKKMEAEHVQRLRQEIAAKAFESMFKQIMN